MNLTIGSKIEAIVVWIDGNKIGLQFKENDMTIDHAGIKYIGIPEEELRAMNKELEELRQWKEAAIKSNSWNMRVEPKSAEAKHFWRNQMRDRPDSSFEAPTLDILKGVAMQMPYNQNKEMANKPYTFDGLTDERKPDYQLVGSWWGNDGPKPTMSEVDEKPWRPKEGEEYWMWDTSRGLAKGWPQFIPVGTPLFRDRVSAEAYGASIKNPDPDSLAGDGLDFQPPLDEKNYDNIKEAAEKARAGFEVAKLKAAVDSGQTIVDEHGSTVERHAISGLEHAVLYRHTLDKSLQYKNYCPASSNWGTISTYMKVTSGWHIKPSSIKPPLGIIPRQLDKERRLNEIYGAITRYQEVSKEIPKEWIEEMEEIERELKPSSPSVNEVIDELKLGRKFRSEDG